MTSDALRSGAISEDTIRDALQRTRGDLFAASGYLQVSPRELDRYIRASDTLQGFCASIAAVKQNAEYDRMSADQFRKELENVTRANRLEAENIIRELAHMSFDSAAMAEVKLKAAVQLRGAHADTPVNSDQALVLAELNKIYQESAPRIKSVRAAIEVEYHSPPAPLPEAHAAQDFPSLPQHPERR